MITALLVDDEPNAIERLAELLESFPGVEVIGTARDVGDAERFLAGRSPDVVFLDINMPGRLGFDLMASVSFGTRVVFVTAHEDRAVDAFRAGAVDYVLKPVDRDRLAIPIDRLEALVASPSSQPRMVLRRSLMSDSTASWSLFARALVRQAPLGKCG